MNNKLHIPGFDELAKIRIRDLARVGNRDGRFSLDNNPEKAR